MKGGRDMSFLFVGKSYKTINRSFAKMISILEKGSCSIVILTTRSLRDFSEEIRSYNPRTIFVTEEITEEITEEWRRVGFKGRIKRRA
jgi:hypothetical protein